MLPEDGGVSLDVLGPRFERHPAPITEGSPGGGHCSFELIASGRGTDRENLFGRRIDDLHRLVAADQLSIDQ